MYEDSYAAILIQTRAGVYKASSAWKTFFFSKMWIFSLFAQKNTFISVGLFSAPLAFVGTETAHQASWKNTVEQKAESSSQILTFD